MSEVNPTASSNDSNEAVAIVKEEPGDHSDEPDAKKPKLESIDEKELIFEKLEQRLGGILCCTVCLDLPKSAIYQCSNGHLMCAGCFSHLLADARLRDENATCPGCRTEISKTTASRNLAVEKAVSELPSECQFCGKEYPRYSLERHEQMLCHERITTCQYSRIGCPWRGPYHEHLDHERVCIHPHNTGAQVLEVLDAMEEKKKEERKMFDSLFDLLSCEKIVFHDLQLKPYRTDEFIHKLYYETARFSAWSQQWVVKARINTNNQKDPTLSCEREMTYQLILKSKVTTPLTVYYMILRGPFSDIKVSAKIYKFEFTEEANETPFQSLPLSDVAECNRLLAAKAINFRLMLSIPSK